MKKNTTAIAILFIILFLVMVGFGIVIPTMPYYITHLGGNPTDFGLFMASYSLMQFFFSPFWGRLSDRMGRRPVILIGLSGYAITFILFGFANELWMMFAIRILSGILSSATLPTAMAYIADSTEGGDRSKVMGMLGAAMGAGMIFGPGLGGWLGHYGFHLPFFAAGGLALLTWPFAYAFLPESHTERGSGVAESQARLSLDVIKHPLFALFVLAFVLHFTMAMFEGTFALFAKDRFDFGIKEMGTLFMMLGVIGVVVQGGLIGRLVKRFGDVNLIKAGLIISAAGLLLIWLSPDRGAMFASTAIFNIGGSLMGPSASTLVSKNSIGGQGASMGLMQSFGSLGRILGPAIGGILYDINVNIPYLVGAAILLLIILQAGRQIEKYEPVAAR